MSGETARIISKPVKYQGSDWQAIRLADPSAITDLSGRTLAEKLGLSPQQAVDEVDNWVLCQIDKMTGEMNQVTLRVKPSGIYAQDGSRLGDSAALTATLKE